MEIKINKEDIINRFTDYVKFWTTSDPKILTTPSTKRQIVFANRLIEDLTEIGLNPILDENGYIYATLPANVEKEIAPIGFIAHMDTAPDYSGENVQPQIIKNYDGKDITLDENSILSPENFSNLKNYIGDTLITTNGKTLLGADDKAGIVEIIEAIKYLKNNPQIKHGEIKVGFTPDEEIGRGAEKFDVERFGAKYAYTIDGGEIGELQYENFNAAEITINIEGKNIHPGSAKNKMINSLEIAQLINSKLPKKEKPEHTEGYEGFYHLTNIAGDVENTSMHYIIRDHNQEKFENRKKLIIDEILKIEKEYKGLKIKTEIKDSYFNMKKEIEKFPEIMERAEKAFQKTKIVPIIEPIRGGTDGANLSFKGLPCPNIFTGGHNFHSKYEYISVESMIKAIEVIINIAQIEE